MKTDYSSSALLIVAHGSTVNPDSSTPTLAHAWEIRRRKVFVDVECAFWKEEPSLRDALFLFDPAEVREVYVVPNFISEGYFTQTVIPREDAAPAETSLLIVAHGTDLNENSAVAAKREAERIRGLAKYADVLNVYMEEPPLVSDWQKLTTTTNVVVVPFFISDGLHSYEDIPRLLGIASKRSTRLRSPKRLTARQATTSPATRGEVFRHNPYQIDGRWLFYAPSIGTDSGFADIIIDQAAKSAGV